MKFSLITPWLFKQLRRIFLKETWSNDKTKYEKIFKEEKKPRKPRGLITTNRKGAEPKRSKRTGHVVNQKGAFGR